MLDLSKEKTEEKKIEHQNFVEKLCNISSEITKARQLGIEFIEMLRKRQGELLDSWLEKAKISGLIDLKNFASGIERDKDAVFNAMTLEWSNGQVEGLRREVAYIFVMKGNNHNPMFYHWYPNKTCGKNNLSV